MAYTISLFLICSHCSGYCQMPLYEAYNCVGAIGAYCRACMYVYVYIISGLQPGQINLHIRIKWVTFSLGHAGHWVKFKNIILSNIAVINNTIVGLCSLCGRLFFNNFQ